MPKVLHKLKFECESVLILTWQFYLFQTNKQTAAAHFAAALKKDYYFL